MTMRPTWVEVSRAALQRNFATVRDFVAPHATVCAMVKANAYGHGAAECALAFQAEGAKWFAATSPEEGVALRQAGVRGRILLTSGFWRGEEEAVIACELTPAIWDWHHVEQLENAAEKMGRPPQSVAVHLKVDTGMARLGISPAELPTVLDALLSARCVKLEGVLTHLASADVIHGPQTEMQLLRYENAVNAIMESGLSPTYSHVANSAGMIVSESAWKSLVRPGIVLYGYHLPFVSAVTGQPDESLELPVKPALAWKTRIIAMRDVGAYSPIGYSGAYVTQGPARLAVLPVGYGDGLSRQLSSRGRAIVRNDYASMVGNITMDLTTIDVTGMPGVDIGDEVILIGESGKRKITAWDHANHAQTIPYEILCNISKRVPRIYVD